MPQKLFQKNLGPLSLPIFRLPKPEDSASLFLNETPSPRKPEKRLPSLSANGTLER